MKYVVTACMSLLFCILTLLACPACSEKQPITQSPTASTSKPAVAASQAKAEARDFGRWEKSISAYEAEDREHFPGKGGVLFLGSSTIRRWKSVGECFPQYLVINRGFGGSHIVDSTHFADRIIFPYEPSLIVLRAGGNDLLAGKSPEQVFADYKAFVATVRKRLPKTWIVYIGINASPSNWTRRQIFTTFNAMIAKYASTRPDLDYVETSDIVLGPDGSLRTDIYADKTHFNEDGYKLLAERIRPFLAKQGG